MRVCLVGNARASHLRRWAAAYRDAGIDTHVLSIRSEPIDGIDLRTVCVGRPNSPGALTTAASYARLAAQARAAIAAIAPDVVHAHYVTTSGVIAHLAGAHPLVVSAWGSDVIPKDGTSLPWWKRRLIGFGLDGADAVTTTSRYMGEWIHRTRPGLSLHLTPFGVDLGSFDPRNTDAASFTVGIAKSLEPKYGIVHALDAFVRVLAEVPDAQLVIAGDGSLRRELESHAVAIGIASRTRWLGRLPHDQIPAFLASIDVLVNPTVVPESFGVVILEGGAAGIPVVGTDVGGVRETCVDGETALLVAPADPVALADALVGLAGDPDRRARMGAAGRAFVEAHYRWEDSVTTMIDVLESVRR